MQLFSARVREGHEKRPMAVWDACDRPFVYRVDFERPFALLAQARRTNAAGASAIFDYLWDGSERAHSSSVQDFKSNFNG